MDTSFCFVNVLLEAGQGPSLAQVRLSQLKQIYGELFRQERAAATKGFQGVGDHDVKILFGDFSSRTQIVEGYDTKLAIQNAKREWKLWLARDEILNGKQNDAFLKGWKEGPITFLPTSRYVPGTTRFDEQWMPAWPDRIFYQTAFKQTQIELEKYASSDVNYSDHKPTRALFSVNCRKIDREKVKQFTDQFSAEFNKSEQEIQMKLVQERIQQYEEKRRAKPRPQIPVTQPQPATQ